MTSGRAVERILPPLHDFLCGTAYTARLGVTAPSRTGAKAAAGRGKHHRPTHHQPTPAGTPPAQPPTEARARLMESYERWRGCFVVWRKVLGSDVLLLALLLHSGCVPSPDYALIPASVSPHHRDGHPRAVRVSVWAANALHFLNIVEVYETDHHSHEDASSDDDDHFSLSDSSILSDASRVREGDEEMTQPLRDRDRGRRRYHDVTATSEKQLTVQHASEGTKARMKQFFSLSSDLVPREPRKNSTDVVAIGGRRRRNRNTGGVPAAIVTAAEEGESGPISPTGAASAAEAILKATVTVTAVDEPQVQRAAKLLVDEWVELFSYTGCNEGAPAGDSRAPQLHECRGLQSVRAYWMSSALKFAAYADGTHSALLEENQHIQALLARQDITSASVAELLNRSVPSILNCFLLEELCGTDAAAPYPLALPPPLLLLPMHLLGMHSRLGLWLPTTAPPPPSPSTLTSHHTGGAASGLSRGECLPCEVRTNGWLAGPRGVTSPGGLWLGLQLLDEAGSATLSGLDSSSGLAVDDLLPVVTSSPGAALDAAPLRALEATAHPSIPGYLRVDVAVPRLLLMHPIPSRITAASEKQQQAQQQPARRCGAIRHKRGRISDHDDGPKYDHITLTTLYGNTHQTHQQSSATAGAALRYIGGLCHIRTPNNTRGAQVRVTMARDPTGCVLQFLVLTARRVLALRDLLRSPQSAMMAVSEMARGKGAARRNEVLHQSAQPTVADGGSGEAAADATHIGGGSGGRAAIASEVPEPLEAEGRLEAVADAAASLTLMALLLSHDLPSALLDQPQVTLWLVEQVSCVADLSVATRRPVPRLLRAAGYALCLLPNRPQSLLVAVGLLGTIGERHIRGMRGVQARVRHRTSAGAPPSPPQEAWQWWTAFQSTVLKDESIPGQLHSGVWLLVQSVEKSLAAATAQMVRRSAAWAAANTTSAASTAAEGPVTKLRLRRGPVADPHAPRKGVLLLSLSNRPSKRTQAPEGRGTGDVGTCKPVPGGDDVGELCCGAAVVTGSALLRIHVLGSGTPLTPATKHDTAVRECDETISESHMAHRRQLHAAMSALWLLLEVSMSRQRDQ